MRKLPICSHLHREFVRLEYYIFSKIHEDSPLLYFRVETYILYFHVFYAMEVLSEGGRSIRILFHGSISEHLIYFGFQGTYMSLKLFKRPN